MSDTAIQTVPVVLDAAELALLEPSRAQQIQAIFEPMAKMLNAFEGAYNEVIAEADGEITEPVMAKAKRLRLDIGKIRTSAEKTRVAEKEKYLRAGKAIDGVSNILKWAVVDKENKLKEIEQHFENMEKERLEKLQVARVGELSQYVDDAAERDLSGMEDDVWDAYLGAKKKAHDDVLEAEKQAEATRLENERLHIAEQDRITKENEKLKAEAVERDRLAKIEEDKRTKEREEREFKECKEREVQDAKRMAQDAKLEEERKARVKAEDELKERQDRERIEAEGKEKAEQAELGKGDKAKRDDLLNDLGELRTKYTFRSKKNQKMYSDVGILLDKIVAHINK